jgi:hypothetical protein
VTTADLVEHILEKLEEVRARCPELRLAQLIATVGMLAENETGHSLWDVEDVDFAAALERFAADMAHREPDTAERGAASDRGGITPTATSTLPQLSRQVS